MYFEEISRAPTLLQKIVAGGPHRKTRFHDHRGNRVPLDRIVRNGPKALASTIQRVTFGKFISTPWVSYDGQAILERHLTSQSRVLEFGSGASTVWFAERAGFVLSHEDDANWFSQVGGIIGEQPNAVRKFHPDREAYATVEPEFAKPFNLILVDGSHRDLCVERTLPLLAEGGILYLDNSDKLACPISGDVPRARRLLIEEGRRRGKPVRFIVDFVASQTFATEATLLFG